jgi:hypothetical protein
MESTGVFWIPLCELLEQRGLKPCVVNARHMKNVQGRRTDWHECQWIQFLHSVPLDSHGILRAVLDATWQRSKHRKPDDLVFTNANEGPINRRNLLRRHLKPNGQEASYS